MPVILLFKQQNCVPSRAEGYSRSEIITPKLVSLPVGGPGLLRNSFCCQQPDPHCSETRFAVNTTLGKRQVSPPNSHGEILGGARVLRVAFADAEKALAESLCQRENPTMVGESDRQKLIQRKSPRFWNLRVPSFSCPSRADFWHRSGRDCSWGYLFTASRSLRRRFWDSP